MEPTITECIDGRFEWHVEIPGVWDATGHAATADEALAAGRAYGSTYQAVLSPAQATVAEATAAVEAEVAAAQAAPAE